MKKLCFLTLCLFLLALLQPSIHMHYCMGSLQDWQLYTDAERCCSHKQHREAHFVAPCCEDEHLSYSLPTYEASKQNISLERDPQTYPSLSDSYTFLSLCYRNSIGPRPPNLLASLVVPIFLLNANLRL